DTFNSSTSAPLLCSALAIAESSTFLIRCADFFALNCRICRASATDFPRTWSATSRAFCAATRTNLNLALPCMTRSLPGLLVGGVTLERTGGGKFAKLVTNHVLADQHRHVLAAVVNGDRQTHHLRQDHGAARPGLDRLAAVLRHRLMHLLREMRIDKWTFMY